jgi:hypothetical protein
MTPYLDARQRVEEKDHGGTSLTEVVGVSVSVPTDQLPHDALMKFAREFGERGDGYKMEADRCGKKRRKFLYWLADGCYRASAMFYEKAEQQLPHNRVEGK